ncbi:MAG: hypothetical protein K2O91_02510 [Lachnospiraceae bacterium]|nr:hypothetical protein [Lachnospiraceae bacterium]
MYIIHSEKNKNTDKRKKALEFIEIFVVAAICIIMYFHERGVSAQNSADTHPTLGESVLFGTYLGEPIEWRVIRAEKNGEVVLIAENILTMKAFDAADSGNFNYDEDDNSYWSIYETEADRDLELQAYVRGNSCWADSDLRTWLNSDRENVVYDGIGPVTVAMSAHKNGYANEPGFLNGFTEQEKGAIVPTENITNGNALDGGEVCSTDLVYLLSEEELSWLVEADVNIRAKPTAQAVEQDQTSWYNMYSLEFGIEAYYWWLREPVPDTASNCYVVDIGYKSRLLRDDKAVGLEGIGVRPVVRVDTRKISLPQKEPESRESEGQEESDGQEENSWE